MTYWPLLPLLTLPVLFLSHRATRHWQALPKISPRPSAPPRISASPSLSIIIPARNEAHNLPNLLPSLSYPGRVEIIVVDDNSTDQTATIAQQHGAIVLTIDQLPAGWLGKPHACHKGALQATGDWLLFTDADTIHMTGGPAGAIQTALQHKCDCLSLFPAQRTTGWLDTAALTAAHIGLFASLSRPELVLNGQYILIQSSVYVKSGGFSAVKGEPLEDLALGHHLNQQGYRPLLGRGESIASVSMYQSRKQMWQGMTRLGSGTLHWAGIRALIPVLFTTVAVFPLIGLALALILGDGWLWVWLSWLIVVVSSIEWTRRFGPGRVALIAPIGSLFVLLAGTWGLLRRLSGRGITWKNRTV